MTDRRTRWYAKSWGAERMIDGRFRIRLWAPALHRMALRLNGVDLPMERIDSDGWFETNTEASYGDTYSFVVSDDLAVPDPATRAQAGDVHGPSLIIDPTAYTWRNSDWKGRSLEETVIYECHVGTFTPEGTFRAAVNRLSYLVDLGITAVEIMPVAHFGGNRGWGYDGVLPYAPHPAYGTPHDMKAFIDAAHGNGLMVFLDVVYNHFGPDGNYLGHYAPEFFDQTRHTPWGPAIAYEKGPVRRFFIENALYWLEEFFLDGLRLDAIDQVRDPRSSPELLVELAQTVRNTITDRQIHLTTEDNRNVAYLHRRDSDGSKPLYSAEWNDDFHNAAHVVATGETDGYYAAYADRPLQKLMRALAEGFAFQGEVFDGKPRGEPSAHLPPIAFIDFIQNHDQIGNRAFGERLTSLADHAMTTALTAMLLLAPHIPLIFMGEEYGEKRPFRFFTDFHGALAKAVRQGRRREFADFTSFQGHPAKLRSIPDPNAWETFEQSRLDWRSAGTADGSKWLALTRHLLAVRRRQIVPLLARAGGHCGEVISAEKEIIAVDWRLAGDKLQMRANMGDHAGSAPRVTGDVIYASENACVENLLPRSVVVALDREKAVS